MSGVRRRRAPASRLGRLFAADHPSGQRTAKPHVYPLKAGLSAPLQAHRLSGARAHANTHMIGRAINVRRLFSVGLPGTCGFHAAARPHAKLSTLALEGFHALQCAVVSPLRSASVRNDVYMVTLANLNGARPGLRANDTDGRAETRAHLAGHSSASLI